MFNLVTQTVSAHSEQRAGALTIPAIIKSEKCHAQRSNQQQVVSETSFEQQCAAITKQLGFCQSDPHGFKKTCLANRCLNSIQKTRRKPSQNRDWVPNYETDNQIYLDCATWRAALKNDVLVLASWRVHWKWRRSQQQQHRLCSVWLSRPVSLLRKRSLHRRKPSDRAASIIASWRHHQWAVLEKIQFLDT